MLLMYFSLVAQKLDCSFLMHGGCRSGTRPDSSLSLASMIRISPHLTARGSGRRGLHGSINVVFVLNVLVNLPWIELREQIS